MYSRRDPCATRNPAEQSFQDGRKGTRGACMTLSKPIRFFVNCNIPEE